MPRTKEQSEKIRALKTKAIMQVALQLFANKGFEQTSVMDISQQANISKGLLYNYFESKEALLNEILVNGIESFYQSFDPDKDGILTGEEFEFFVRETFRLQNDNKEFYKLYYALVMQPKVTKVVEQITRNLSPRILIVLQDYFVRNFEDPYTEMIILTSMIKGLSIQYLYSNGSFTENQINKAIEKIIYLYKRP